MKPKVLAKWLGLVSYGRGVELQQFYRNQLRNQTEPETSAPQCSENILLLLEHPPVYTVGVRRQGYSEIDEQRLRSLGADFHYTDRGGLITFHGPGQLVVYPILRLGDFQSKRSVKWYVKTLEDCVVDLCKFYGIHSGINLPHTGIWVGERKICAIGIHVGHGITSHGLALNCCTELHWFDYIVPCGIEGKGVTSITQLTHRTLQPHQVVPQFINCFANCFDCDVNLSEVHEIIKIAS